MAIDYMLCLVDTVTMTPITYEFVRDMMVKKSMTEEDIKHIADDLDMPFDKVKKYVNDFIDDMKSANGTICMSADSIDRANVYLSVIYNLLGSM